MEKKSMITRIGDGLCSVEKTITWIAFAVMLGLLLIQVFCRYVFHMPLAWAEELVRYTYVAVSFTGAIVAVRKNEHISIDILISLIDSKIKDPKKNFIVMRCVDIFAFTVQSVFFAILSYWMLIYNIDIAAKNQISTANEWPIWVLCSPVTVSLFLMCIHAVLNVLEAITSIINAKKGGAVVNG